MVETIAGEPYTDAGATCTDDIDNPPPNAVTRFSTVDIHTPGIYTVFYDCTDSDGNSASDIRVVEVVPAGTNLHPVLTVPSSVTFTVRDDDNFTAPSATCTDPDDDDMNLKIDVIDNLVDPTQVGRYTVFYTCTDPRRQLRDRVAVRERQPRRPVGASAGGQPSSRKDVGAWPRNHAAGRWPVPAVPPGTSPPPAGGALPPEKRERSSSRRLPAGR